MYFKAAFYILKQNTISRVLKISLPELLYRSNLITGNCKTKFKQQKSPLHVIIFDYLLYFLRLSILEQELIKCCFSCLFLVSEANSKFLLFSLCISPECTQTDMKNIFFFKFTSMLSWLASLNLPNCYHSSSFGQNNRSSSSPEKYCDESKINISAVSFLGFTWAGSFS